MSNKKITSALISVFYKDGLAPLVTTLHQQGVKIYSTGGTQKFIEDLNIPCIPVEHVTSYPSILGGRVKTLHPNIFGGILGRRDLEQDVKEMAAYNIPEIDLVIVDLYPFEETLKSTTEEAQIIEKIDIGGPSMIRAAAKNFKHIMVVAAKSDYQSLIDILAEQNGIISLEQRKQYAAKAFHIVMNYDIAINNYFNGSVLLPLQNVQTLRYGENPHQNAHFYGDLENIFTQLNGKNLSYNNLVDADAAVQLIEEFQNDDLATFAIIKHTNVCGVAQAQQLSEAWDLALAGDPESAFGGVLIANKAIDITTANKINELFFEVLIAPSFNEDALSILKSKKNRMLLVKNGSLNNTTNFRNVLNGVLTQTVDNSSYDTWNEVGAFETNAEQQADLKLANIICKHLKSNAIAIVKNKQLLGKGCGQTSRIDALKQAIDKANQFNLNLSQAALASDAFFPFDDCVKIAHEAGINTIIQPGGSVRDQDSINFCKQHNIAMVLTGVRHFKH